MLGTIHIWRPQWRRRGGEAASKAEDSIDKLTRSSLENSEGNSVSDSAAQSNWAPENFAGVTLWMLPQPSFLNYNFPLSAPLTSLVTSAKSTFLEPNVQQWHGRISHERWSHNKYNLRLRGPYLNEVFINLRFFDKFLQNCCHIWQTPFPLSAFVGPPFQCRCHLSITPRQKH